jgi:hypothetical protein
MDKRKFYRFNVNLEVRYRILESLKPYERTFTEDMCGKGIRINLPQYLEPQTRLELTIRVPDENMSIMTIGRVAWVKKDISGEFFNTGIQLVYIREKDKEKFYKFALL